MIDTRGHVATIRAGCFDYQLEVIWDCPKVTCGIDAILFKLLFKVVI